MIVMTTSGWDSVKGFAEVLQVAPSTVYRWISAGRVDATQVNGRFRIVHSVSSGLTLFSAT